MCILVQTRGRLDDQMDSTEESVFNSVLVGTRHPHIFIFPRLERPLYFQRVTTTSTLGSKLNGFFLRLTLTIRSFFNVFW